MCGTFTVVNIVSLQSAISTESWNFCVAMFGIKHNS